MIDAQEMHYARMDKVVEPLKWILQSYRNIKSLEHSSAYCYIHLDDELPSAADWWILFWYQRYQDYCICHYLQRISTIMN